MAQLDATDRLRIQRGLMRYWSNIRELVAGSKDELLTTIGETDTWINDNAASFNSALTYAANYTAAQKTLIFCCVAAMRFNPTVATLLRRLLSVEVD